MQARSHSSAKIITMHELEPVSMSVLIVTHTLAMGIRQLHMGVFVWALNGNVTVKCTISA